MVEQVWRLLIVEEKQVWGINADKSNIIRIRIIAILAHHLQSVLFGKLKIGCSVTNEKMISKETFI